MRGVNGLPLRHEAIVKDGVTYVPLRAVAESLGCTVDGALYGGYRGISGISGTDYGLASGASAFLLPKPIISSPGS